MSSEQAQSNAAKIEQQINNLKKLSSQHRYGEFWTHSKQVVWMFKTYKPLFREDRERLWSKYGGICEVVKKGAESKRGESKVNAAIIKSEITKLREDYSNINLLNNSNRQYKGFWSRAKRISEFFKGLPISREDREGLWADYDGIFKEMKAKQKSHEEGREDGRSGRIDLCRYVADNEYKTAFEIEERQRLCPNLCDLDDLSWYHKLADGRKAEHELDKTERRAQDERKVLEKIRKKREKEIKKVLGKGLLGKIRNLSGRKRELHWRAPND